MLKKFLCLAMVFTVCVLYCNAQTLNASKPSSASLLKGKGTLSFTLGGKYYATDTAHTKCWTTAGLPVAILWSTGEGLAISWQIQDVNHKGVYRIDKDSKGTINFTVAGKTYWIVKTDGSNYLSITITGIKDVYTVKLLSGSFEGILEDKDGNKVQVKNGKFITEGI